MKKIMKLSSITSGLKKAKERWSEDKEELLQDALLAGYDGDYEGALEILDKTIYLFDTNLDESEIRAQFWGLKAAALRELERFDEALKAIEKAIKIDKKNPNHFIEKLEIFHDMEKYDDSFNTLQQAYKLGDKELKDEFFFMKAHLLGHLDKNQEALELYNKALQKDPKDTNSLYEKSQVLLELGKTKESLKVAEKSLEIDPEDKDVLVHKGVVLMELERNEEALSCFNKAIQFDSSDEDAWYNTACALSILNKKEEALDALTVATALDSTLVATMQEDEDLKNIWKTERFARLANQEI